MSSFNGLFPILYVSRDWPYLIARSGFLMFT